MALSVKGKLQALCAVIVAGFALVFVVDILESRLTERTLALERLAVTARIEALEMRRQEKNFFLRHDPEALAAVRRHQEAAVAAIEAIRADDPDHDPLSDAALARLRAYHDGFEAIAGFSGDPDAADPTARYLDSSQDLERLADSQPELAGAVARLARLEKRWLASGTADNLRRLTREAERLRDGGPAGPPSGDAARVLGDYLAALGDYASRLEDAGSATAGFVSAARALEPVTEALRAAYEARRNAIARVTDLLDFGIQAAVLVLVALAAWGLFRAVATPLERLRRHARRLVRGEGADLDPTEYSGEFRDLAADIAAMESHLLATIRELAAKEREAADQACKAEAARQQAEELGRVKTDFLSLVSHEFKTPLTSMVGFAQVMRKRLERGPLAEQAGHAPEIAAEVERLRHNLAIMLEEGRKLAGLIDNVLELAALDADDLPLVPASLAPAEIIDRAAAPHLAAMAAKGLAFVRDIPGDLPPLRGDRDRLVFVFDQLLSNAVKFTKDGHIACRAGLRDGMAVIAVEDTGQGIPADMGEAVFEKFFQLGDVTTGKMPGLGIGLAAARAVVKRHGGAITAHGLPGRGVRVEVALPLFEAAP
ncbi:MAG TPA: HAMP domain-containing sensor histidine kinase [Solidesulfovibrio magneticus]|nr:HAMP domain-containing sensor histidine kinase [Solidesulfovibrio magneticus]